MGNFFSFFNLFFFCFFYDFLWFFWIFPAFFSGLGWTGELWSNRLVLIWTNEEDIYLFILLNKNIFQKFWIFLIKVIFWDFQIFLPFLNFFLFFLLILFKVTKVTTKSYQDYYWSPQIGQNCIISLGRSPKTSAGARSRTA